MLPSITGEFTLVADPELRFTPSGNAVASVRLVANGLRRADNGKMEKDPDKVCWLRGTIWRETAENLVESVKKGDLVLVTGDLKSVSWEDRDGNKRESVELEIRTIGPSLRFRSTPHSGEQRRTRERPAQQHQNAGSRYDAEDPWASTPPNTDEPPF